MKNIITCLGTDIFTRIKVGIGKKPREYDLADYVLSRFGKEERILVEEAYVHAVRAAEQIVKGEIQSAMNEYNRKVKVMEE